LIQIYKSIFLIRANLCYSRTFLVFVLLAVSCTKTPTDSRTGTLTGTVLLEGQTDHSGITVALYKLAELDTTILRYNREYPNVGFPISQATEFACPPGFWRNHRLGEVVAESKTNADGSLKIENKPEGSPREINSSVISRGGYNFCPKAWLKRRRRMSEQQEILKKIQNFPPNRIEEVADFIEFIERREKRKAWIEFDEWAMNLAKEKGFYHLNEEDVAQIVKQHRLKA